MLEEERNVLKKKKDKLLREQAQNLIKAQISRETTKVKARNANDLLARLLKACDQHRNLGDDTQTYTAPTDQFTDLRNALIQLREDARKQQEEEKALKLAQTRSSAQGSTTTQPGQRGRGRPRKQPENQ